VIGKSTELKEAKVDARERLPSGSLLCAELLPQLVKRVALLF